MRNVLFSFLAIAAAVFGLTASVSALPVSTSLKSSVSTADQPLQVRHRRHGGFSINLGYGGFGYGGWGYGRPYRYYGGYYPAYGAYYDGYSPSYSSRYYEFDDDYYDEPVYRYRSYKIRKHWDGGRDYRRSRHHRHHRRHRWDD